MIVKFYQIKDVNINKNKFILFYGVNEGLKKEEISKLTNKEKKENIIKYEEKEVLENSENFLNSIYSKSLFEDKKIIIINQASDKILNLINEKQIIQSFIWNYYLNYWSCSFFYQRLIYY